MYSIPLDALAITLLVIFAGVITVYLVNTLSSLNRTLKNVNFLIETNRKNIDDTLSSLPQICSNVNEVTQSVKDKTDILDSLVDRHSEAAAASDVENLISSISSIIELFLELKGLFEKKKRKIF